MAQTLPTISNRWSRRSRFPERSLEPGEDRSFPDSPDQYATSPGGTHMSRALRGMLPVVGSLALLVAAPAPTAADTSQTPAWYGHGHRVSSSGDLVVHALAMGNNSTIATSRSGSSCAAEPSTTGNVQVNCLAEDGRSRQNTQSETSVAAVGNTVVVGFNDSLVCCFPAINFT